MKGSFGSFFFKENMNLIRVTTGLKDIGKIIPKNELYSYVDTKRDYFRSLYNYKNDAFEYFKEHGKIKGYQGKVTTKYLVFDFDAEDIAVARRNLIILIEHLTKLGLFRENCSQISFSGSKGFHLFIKTEKDFTPRVLKKFCINLTQGVPFVEMAEFKLDPSIYNTNRIFRITNTINEKSGLYKVNLRLRDVYEWPIEKICEYATTPQPEILAEESICSDIVKDAIRSFKVDDSTPHKVKRKNPTGKSSVLFNFYPCYNSIYEGKIDKGDSNTALIRLANFFRLHGYDEDECLEELLKVGERRHEWDETLNPFGEERIRGEVLSCIYSGEGYTYTSTDEYLKSKCEGACRLHTQDQFIGAKFAITPKKTLTNRGFTSNIEGKRGKDLERRGFKTFGETAKTFRKFAKEVNKRRVETGISEFDDFCKIIPNGLTIINARPGVGKCLKFGTKVLMYDGSTKEVQDIVEGDLLMGDDSTPRKVLGTCVGKEKMYDVVPVKGETWGCNESHILSLICNTDVNAAFKKGQIYNISVKEYLQLPAKTQSKLKQYRTGIEFKGKKVGFDPYLVGIWLAEGSFSSTNITTGDTEVVNEVTKRLPSSLLLNYQGYKKSAHYLSVVTKKGQKNPFRDYIQGSCIIDGEKRIPREYLINDRTTRLELLSALLDGDGHLINNCFEITTKYKGLSEDMLYLCRSLGLAAYSKIKKVKLSGWEKSRDYYQVFISGNLDEIPNKVPRKKAQPRKQIKNVLHTGFELVDKGEGSYYGFEIDGNRLFVLGDFTVTHNTSLALKLLKNASGKGIKTAFYCADMDEDEFFSKAASSALEISPDDVYELYNSDEYADMVKSAEKQVSEQLENVLPNYEQGISVDKIDSDLQALVDKGEEVGLIIIDYVQKLEGCHDYGRGAEAVMKLKKLVSKYKVPIIALSQIPRVGGDEETPIFTAAAAKGGSIYEETASIVINLWRPMKFHPEGREMDQYIAFKIAKNRMGECPPDNILYFDGAISEIRSLTEEELLVYQEKYEEYQEMKRPNRGKKGKFTG